MQMEPGQQRFEVWVKDVPVVRSDTECFVKIFIDGVEVYNLEAQMDYEDPETKRYGERPMPVGFSVTASASKLDGSERKNLGKRTWVTTRNTEVKE